MNVIHRSPKTITDNEDNVEERSFTFYVDVFLTTKNPSFSYQDDDDDEMVDYKLGYFAMVVAVHRALLLIRGE